ncbi:MAG: hypothetical protein JSR83_15435 [Proteobacteria bacterium]|nr:hypothetical protein [Pseudomonadota bacterium]
MAFVNEYLSEDDCKKYEIHLIDERFVVGGTSSNSWTIDRDRNIYLRTVARGREEFSHLSTWTLYWHEDLIVLELENLSTSGPTGGVCHGHKRVRSIEIPPHLEDKRADILSDLKDALTAYKDGGVYARATEYTLTLDV